MLAFRLDSFPTVLTFLELKLAGDIFLVRLEHLSLQISDLILSFTRGLKWKGGSKEEKENRDHEDYSPPTIQSPPKYIHPNQNTSVPTTNQINHTCVLPVLKPLQKPEIY